MDNEDGLTLDDHVSGNDMSVTRCICLNLSFEHLHTIAVRDGLNFRQLQRLTRCASSCRMCEPYIRVMLANGQTAFRVMRPGAVARIMNEARREEAQGQPGQAGEQRESAMAGGGAADSASDGGEMTPRETR